MYSNRMKSLHNLYSTKRIARHLSIEEKGMELNLKTTPPYNVQHAPLNEIVRCASQLRKLVAFCLKNRVNELLPDLEWRFVSTFSTHSLKLAL